MFTTPHLSNFKRGGGKDFYMYADKGEVVEVVENHGHYCIVVNNAGRRYSTNTNKLKFL